MRRRRCPTSCNRFSRRQTLGIEELRVVLEEVTGAVSGGRTSPRLHLREAQQRSIVSLPVDQSGIDPRFEARRRMPENSPALARWTSALVADLAVAPSAAHR